MKIAVASDHGGYALKEEIKKFLEGKGIDHTYREAPGMHNWAFWDAEIQHALAFMFG